MRVHQIELRKRFNGVIIGRRLRRRRRTWTSDKPDGWTSEINEKKRDRHCERNGNIVVLRHRRAITLRIASIIAFGTQLSSQFSSLSLSLPRPVSRAQCSFGSDLESRARACVSPSSAAAASSWSSLSSLEPHALSLSVNLNAKLKASVRFHPLFSERTQQQLVDVVVVVLMLCNFLPFARSS